MRHFRVFFSFKDYYVLLSLHSILCFLFGIENFQKLSMEEKTSFVC